MVVVAPALLATAAPLCMPGRPRRPGSSCPEPCSGRRTPRRQPIPDFVAVVHRSPIAIVCDRVSRLEAQRLA